MSSLGAMVAAAVFAYLMGCLQGGYYLVRFRTGHDIREQGSGGTGARNAGRVLGRSGFLAVFLIDCLKGVTAVWLATAMGTGRVGMAVAAIAVGLGHIFPVQLQFRGGKGASSALGALLVLTPPVAITSLIVSAAFYLISRKAVASGVATFALMPAFAIMFGSSTSDLIAVTAITVLLLATHRSSLAEIAGVFRRGKSVTRKSAR